LGDYLARRTVIGEAEFPIGPVVFGRMRLGSGGFGGGWLRWVRGASGYVYFGLGLHGGFVW
jgi:hypothetical protein